MLKVMRPKNWDPKKLKFPCWVQPKIDGCRAYNPEGTLLARTMKKHANLFTTKFYSTNEHRGFDGELAAAHECDPALMRITGSALSTITGEPFTLWHIFDYITDLTITLPYSQRYDIAKARMELLQSQGMCGHLRMVPYIECNSLDEVYAVHACNMAAGFEGSCVYNPKQIHKQGDSSPTHGGVVRIKDFVDVEVKVLEIIEGSKNLNVAQINELGHTFRTSHQENLEPNGMVGTLVVAALADVYDLYDKKLLLVAQGQVFNASPGKMTNEEAADFFLHPEKIVEQIGKVKFFPKGMKDAPRFPQWIGFRSAEDM
jgi:DNA ligase-1